MMEDRNKTELTRSVTAAAYRYLDERGCRPLETEVPVNSAWIADLAGLLCPTMTELVALKLLKRRPRWNHPDYSPWWERAKDLQDSIGSATVLVEIKTSRQDLERDRKWTEGPQATLQYLAVPPGLVPSIPEEWGILRYVPGGDFVRCERPPIVLGISDEQKLNVAWQIACRRDSHTRYERSREFNRAIRRQRNEDISITRLSSALRATLAVVRGEHGSAREALKYHGIRNPPGWLIKEIEASWGLCVKRSQNS